ncbi:MAG TPA: class I SAM-dependent methyltransferase [Bryobacteraceae bacterium]|nr:class I SAM-dependent methyltransferase [Bryobacteraceae bacterium]
MATATARPYRGMGMEGFVARWYASLTSKSIDELKALARKVARDLPPRAEVLEVAPGPGYFAIELAKLGAYKIEGVDISRTFVEIATKNAEQAGVDVSFHEGDVANLPFADRSFDFLLCRAAFKNFSRPVVALTEMHRVLKPGGYALIIDLRKDASNESITQAVDEMGLGTLNRALTKMIFRTTLLKRAYTRRQFEVFLLQTKFGHVEIEESPTGLELKLYRGA